MSGPYFHGGPQIDGDLILPASASLPGTERIASRDPAPGRGMEYDPDRVYICANPWWALAETMGTSDGRVYEVEPIGRMEIDISRPGTPSRPHEFTSWSVDRAKVLGIWREGLTEAEQADLRWIKSRVESALRRSDCPKTPTSRAERIERLLARDRAMVACLRQVSRCTRPSVLDREFVAALIRSYEASIRDPEPDCVPGARELIGAAS